MPTLTDSLYNTFNFMSVLQAGFKAATQAKLVALDSPTNPGFPSTSNLPAILWHPMRADRSAFFDFGKLDSRSTRSIASVLDPGTFDIDIEKTYVYHYPQTVTMKLFESPQVSYSTPRQTALGMIHDIVTWIHFDGKKELHDIGVEIKEVHNEFPHGFSDIFTPPTDLDIMPAWNLDLEFNVQEAFYQTIPNIETVKLTRTVKDADGTILDTDLITVNRTDSPVFPT